MTSTPQIHSPLYRWLLLSLLGVLVGETPPGAPFSGFGDLNSPDTFPLIQMATFEPFGGSGGGAPPGGPFSGFGDPVSYPHLTLPTSYSG